MGRPVMSENWVLKAWARRWTLFSSAVSDEMVKNFWVFNGKFFRNLFLAQMTMKLPPFYDLKLAFSGFSDDESVHMQEQAVAYGNSCQSTKFFAVFLNRLIFRRVDQRTWKLYSYRRRRLSVARWLQSWRSFGHRRSTKRTKKFSQNYAKFFLFLVVLGQYPVECLRERRYVPGAGKRNRKIFVNVNSFKEFFPQGHRMAKRFLSPSASDPIKSRNGAFRRSTSSDKRLSCSFLDASGDASSVLAGWRTIKSSSVWSKAWFFPRSNVFVGGFRKFY